MRGSWSWHKGWVKLQLLTQRLAFVSRRCVSRERKLVRAPGSAVGWCNNKACSLQRLTLSHALSLTPFTFQPRRCRCTDAKWNTRVGCCVFSLPQSCPLGKRTPGFKERRGRDRSSHLLSMSTVLKFTMHYFILPSPVPLSSFQLSDWEMAGETGVFCLGRWAREDRGLQTCMCWNTHALEGTKKCTPWTSLPTGANTHCLKQ